MYLPSEIARDLWTDAAGRMSWPPERVRDVVERAAANHMAVVAGEVWWVINREAPTNVILGKDGKSLELRQWRMEPGHDSRAEDWGDFCRRCEFAANQWMDSLDLLIPVDRRWRDMPIELRIHFELLQENDAKEDEDWS